MRSLPVDFGESFDMGIALMARCLDEFFMKTVAVRTNQN